MHIEIDADIRRASTLPASCYTDEAFFAAVRERVFARAWHFAGDLDFEGARPFEAAGEPLVLTRDGAGDVCGLSNVCTHRGNLVVTEPCSARELACGYHGRRFGLDGRFVHMPEFEAALDFPSPGDDLPRVACETWGPFAFVSLDPAFAFADLVAPLRDEPRDGYALDPARSRTYDVAANWALYCDNYLEGFHIPFVHAGLNRELDYGQYRTELHRYANVQVGVGADGAEAARYWWLFPNLMLNFYPWGISVNVVEPVAVDRTRVRFLSYVRDAARLDTGAGADLDRVEEEDEAIVEACQNGMRARLYTRGRYSPAREQGVHHFHRLLAAQMNA